MANYKLGFSKGSYKREVDGMVFKDLFSLDEYTTKFKNETALKVALLDKQFISTKDVTCNVRVLYNNNKKVKEKMVFYRDTKKYLDIYYLRSRILGSNGDIALLKKIENEYGANQSMVYQLTKIRRYIRTVKELGYTYHDEDVYQALNSLFNKAISKSSISKENGKKEYVLDYTKFRNLAVLVYKYDNKIQDELDEVKDMFEEEDPLVASYKGEQIGIFDAPIKTEEKESRKDIFDDDVEYSFAKEEEEEIEDDYEEPLFPPNSAEEARYQRYMENLPDEFSDNDYKIRRR